MLNIFIADDESLVRDSIRSCIDENTTEFAICGEAADGELALPLIRELKPDILILDVKMPFMDGLELASTIKKSMPWIHIAILSGHDEFEYAQRAVSIGVDAYILKPVVWETLLDVLETIRREIEKKRRELIQLERTHEKALEEKMAWKEQFLSLMVTGAVSLQQVIKFSQENNMELIFKKYLVCHSELTGLPKHGVDQIRILADSLFNNHPDIIWFLKGMDVLVYIVGGDQMESVVETAYAMAQFLLHELERNLGVTGQIGIGSVVERVDELPLSYGEAKTVFKNWMINTQRRIASNADLYMEQQPLNHLQDKDMLMDEVVYTTPEELPALVQAYFQNAGHVGVGSVLYRFYLLMDLIVYVQKHAAGQKKDLFEIKPTELMRIAQSLHDTVELAVSQIQCLMTDGFVRRLSSTADVLRWARGYIKKHYPNPDLSLKTVAGEVGFSPSHFSTLFSQEVGCTFIEYLTQCRINAAKEFLEGDRKLAEVASLVGYNDPSYFSYVFKKQLGVSPKEYRKVNQKN